MLFTFMSCGITITFFQSQLLILFSVSSQNPRRKWSKEEIQAVEKTLMDYIHSGKVPGKAQCMECIERSQAALQGRRWEAVKFYVKNRIDALKRKM